MVNHNVSILVFLILFLSCHFGMCQKRKIVVCDAQTHEGIPFATVKVLNRPTGICADENGCFNLSLQENDSLLITRIGYFTKSEKANKDTIFLEEKETFLNEIPVTPKKTKNYFFGNANTKLEKKSVPFITDGKSASFTEMVSLIEIPDNFQNYKINGVLMIVENPKGKPLTRLHIYAPDLNGLPGEEILREDIIINHCINRNKIDLSRFDLFSNERKLFVGFEFLVTDFQEFLVTDFQEFKSVSQNRIGFCFTESIPQNFTYIRTVFSEKYKWRPIFALVNNGNPIPDNLMVSLIIE